MHQPTLQYQSHPPGVPITTPLPQTPSAPTTTSKELVQPAVEDAFYFRALEEEGILLNGPQIDAVRHGHGPLLTLAGAGCGKTTVLAARTGYLIAVRGVPASQILLVTFTSKAAAEIKARIANIPCITPLAARSVQARTFHSFGLAVLRQSGQREQILSDFSTRHTIMKIILRRLKVGETYQPETLLAALSSWKMNGEWPTDLPSDTAEELKIKKIMLAYEEWKQGRNQWDFDDILLHTTKLLNDPSRLTELQSRFSYLMVDEFQDTNTVQYDIVRKLSAGHRNLMVVGDDDQTIYSFNGARQESVLQFDQVYPDATIISLPINYRSDSRILGLGTALIAHNVFRRNKQLVAAGSKGNPPYYASPMSVEEEASFVVDHIEEQVRLGEISYSDIAILHRTAGSSRSVLEQLLIRGIPFVQYGNNTVFYDQTIIKTLMDHLRLSLDPRCKEAFQSTLGPLYISREEGLNYLMEQERKQSKKYPLIHLSHWDRLQPFQQAAVKERIRLIKKLTSLKPVYAIREMRRIFYDKYLEAGDPLLHTQYKETLTDSLDELESAAERFSTVEQFIAHADELTLRHQQMEDMRDGNAGHAVQLLTIHRAKGMEFRQVYWIGASEGILPHSTVLKEKIPQEMKATHPQTAESKLAQAAIEEERRLAYVAVTRAKESLYITSPSHYHGKAVEPSRFILEAFGVIRKHSS
ncbi:ATP-dependent helicase [Paenibacillus crassostreae]|uniref:DNA 3'-5' helicase n=1 Tax=Paenibacillus crassostreae TaxID=1763538 RepID=A0A167BSG8_9BACL|nr:ATP-dependent helicase [Paenibacillus crassostreae]AOZ92444.1 DNA helicase UvrD [Paenibacillus crassostreae]OAB72392.1 DNA helicase UvrD [Paenibacillus crassostreae]